MLDNIILPKLGAKKVDAIGRRDIEAIQIAMKDRPYQANRVLSLLSKMFNLAVEWKWRPDNPAKGVERYQEQKRERWLSDEELAISVPCSTNIQTREQLMLCVSNCDWRQAWRGFTSREEDFDLHRGIWTKPSHQTKQKRTEHLPLSAQALILVTLIIETSHANFPFLFPGNKPGQSLREIKKFWSAVMRKAGLRTIAGTTTGTLMRPISFPADSASRSSGDCWGTRQRQRPSVTLISRTILCVPPPTGLARRLPVSTSENRT